MKALHILLAPVARHRRLSMALPLVFACSNGWAQSGAQPPDLRTAYEWRNLRVDFAVTNLLDRPYASPLGGTWQSALYPPGFVGATFRPLPGEGRSFDTGFSVKF